MSAPSSPLRPRRYAVLVPVKRPVVAKSRLATLGDASRRALAAAFASDTVSAVLGSDRVERVLVVTDDHVLAEEMTQLGAETVPDGAGDLNGTLLQAAAEMRRRAPDLSLATVCADLPALRSGELSSALEAADRTRMSFVADEQRAGTTAVMSPDLDGFRPAFGRASRRRHLEAGAVEIGATNLASLRRDVDDPIDLATALALGVGPRTSRVCGDLGLHARQDSQVVAAGTRTRLTAVQATVSAYDPSTGQGRVLHDDGTELAFPADAVAAGGLRLLRIGQRVGVETDDAVPPRIRRLYIAGMG